MNKGNPRGICCNDCSRELTEEELAVYDVLWQYSGDMYCSDCRDCPDDCRRTPCRLTQVAERNEIEC